MDRRGHGRSRVRVQTWRLNRDRRTFLCRQGTVEDVRQKAIELGLSESGHRTCWLIGPWPVSLVYPVGTRYNFREKRDIRYDFFERAMNGPLQRLPP